MSHHPMSEPWLDWQPRESAPKDGTLLLVCGGELDRPALTWWHHSEGWMNGDGRSGKLFYEFSQWAVIPLPRS
jgi:hypothetical protein